MKPENNVVAEGIAVHRDRKGATDAAAGPAMLSKAQLFLIRRAGSIECKLERLDAMLGAEVDLDCYGRAPRTCAGFSRRSVGLELAWRARADSGLDAEAARMGFSALLSEPRLLDAPLTHPTTTPPVRRTVGRVTFVVTAAGMT